MSIPRRLGRLARGFVSGLGEEERLRETLRLGRERSETLRSAFGAAWRGASEEWRAAEARDREAREAGGGEEEGSRSYRQTAEEYIRDWEERQREARREGRGWGGARAFVPTRYPPEVIRAYDRLGLDTGATIDEVNRKRRDLVRRYHPDRFSDPDKRVRAERLTAEINASHDVIERHLLRR